MTDVIQYRCGYDVETPSSMIVTGGNVCTFDFEFLQFPEGGSGNRYDHGLELEIGYIGVSVTTTRNTL